MNRARLIYWVDCAPQGNPVTVMRQFAAENNLVILGAAPQSVADQWWFWVAFEAELPPLPSHLVKGDWREVGTV